MKKHITKIKPLNASVTISSIKPTETRIIGLACVPAEAPLTTTINAPTSERKV